MFRRRSERPLFDVIVGLLTILPKQLRSSATTIAQADVWRGRIAPRRAIAGNRYAACF